MAVRDARLAAADTPELQAFYPTDVLSTARDILFLWVARMIMMGLEFAGDVPFDDVYIHSVIQAPDGRRMSKSLGTGIDPLDEIEKHGADGVRFGLLAMSSSQDVRYSAEKVQQGEQLDEQAVERLAPDPHARRPGRPRRARAPRAIEDRWILSRLAAARATFDAARSTAFDFSHAALALYDFVYGELCDWYLELVKPRLYEAEGEERADLDATLLHVLDRDARARAPGDPVRDRGDLVVRAGRRGAARGAAGPTPPTTGRRATRRPSARSATRSRRCQALRGWRDGVGAPAGARIPARLEASGYEQTAAHVARLARFELATARTARQTPPSIAIPGGAVRSCTRATRSTSARPSASSPSAAQRSRPRSPAARASSPTRASSRRRRRRSSRPSATKLARLRAELEAL